MEGYYDYRPLVVLDKPIALIGFMGSRASMTGYTMSALTGLPYSELDRLVEHQAGKTRSQIVAEEGRAALDQYEERALETALARQPHGIIVASDTMLTRPVPKARLLRETMLVYIKRPLDVLFDEVHHRASSGAERYPEFLFAPLEVISELRAVYNARQSSYLCAHRIYEAGDRHPRNVAHVLLKQLGI